MGLVDALQGLDLIAGRMASVRVDFLLAGPVSLWLQGLARADRVEPLYLVLVSSSQGNPDLARRAAEPLSRPAPWPEEYEAIVEGRVVSVEIRGGLRLAVAADPVVEAGGERLRINIAEEARSAKLALVGDRPVRLARPGLELLLRGEKP